MTQCTTQLAFSFRKNPHVIADFQGGEITGDAGLLVLRELDDRLGWSKAAASELADRRDPAKTVHQIRDLFRQRLFGLVGGYEDGNDHNRLRTDPALKLACGREIRKTEDLASQPTLSRFENAVTARQVARLNRLLVRQYIQLHRDDPPDEMVLDMDPTDDPCHGGQQLALFNGFYDQYMYLPLLVLERKSGMLLGVRLRAGNAHASHRQVQLLRPIVEALREAFPETKLILRADAGHAVPRLYQFCEANDVGYLIGIAAQSPFRDRTDWALSWLKERFQRDGRACRWIGGFKHRAGTWDRERRVLYKAEVNAEGTNRRFLVTNLPGLPVHLFPRYNDRGTAESFIHQLKNHLSCDRLSCSRFVANAFRLALSGFAYNLLVAYRMQLRGTDFEAASAETLRSRLLKIGARVRQTARRIWVHLAGGFPLRELLAKVMARIGNLHPPPLRT